jgi:hypothetical protein
MKRGPSSLIYYFIFLKKEKYLYIDYKLLGPDYLKGLKMIHSILLLFVFFFILGCLPDWVLRILGFVTLALVLKACIG